MYISKTTSLLVGMLTMLLVMGCGQTKDNGGAQSGGDKPAAEKSASDKPASGTNTVTLGASDQMMYDTKKITVKGGQKVKLTLKHNGKMAKEAMGHNFVLLKKDVDLQAFATKAMAAKATDYIPAEMKDAIVAHTKLLGGGQSDTITFDAPEPGTYKFLCTFPGHYGLMQGDFVVN
ncbi:MAG: azurin [Myxococcota bacterium]